MNPGVKTATSYRPPVSKISGIVRRETQEISIRTDDTTVVQREERSIPELYRNSPLYSTSNAENTFFLCRQGSSAYILINGQSVAERITGIPIALEQHLERLTRDKGIFSVHINYLKAKNGSGKERIFESRLLKRHTNPVDDRMDRIGAMKEISASFFDYTAHPPLERVKWYPEAPNSAYLSSLRVLLGEVTVGEGAVLLGTCAGHNIIKGPHTIKGRLDSEWILDAT